MATKLEAAVLEENDSPRVGRVISEDKFKEQWQKIHPDTPWLLKAGGFQIGSAIKIQAKKEENDEKKEEPETEETVSPQKEEQNEEQETKQENAPPSLPAATAGAETAGAETAGSETVAQEETKATRKVPLEEEVINGEKRVCTIPCTNNCGRLMAPGYDQCATCWNEKKRKQQELKQQQKRNANKKLKHDSYANSNQPPLPSSGRGYGNSGYDGGYGGVNSGGYGGGYDSTYSSRGSRGSRPIADPNVHSNPASKAQPQHVSLNLEAKNRKHGLHLSLMGSLRWWLQSRGRRLWRWRRWLRSERRRWRLCPTTELLVKPQRRLGDQRRRVQWWWWLGASITASRFFRVHRGIDPRSPRCP